MAAQTTFRDSLLKKELRVPEEGFLKREFNRSLSENTCPFVSQAGRMIFVDDAMSCPRIVSSPSLSFLSTSNGYKPSNGHRDLELTLDLCIWQGRKQPQLLGVDPRLERRSPDSWCPALCTVQSSSLMVTQGFLLSSKKAVFVLGILQVSSLLPFHCLKIKAVSTYHMEKRAQ